MLSKGAASSITAGDVPLHDGTAAAQSVRRKVLVLGLFPPPVNGQRIVTQRMFDEIALATTAMRRELDRFPRLGFLSKPLSAVAASLVMAPARLAGFSAVYLAPHSGIGLLYSSFLAGASRFFGFTLFVHYHSYRNMQRRSPLMALFLLLCGPRAVHIVLAPPMERGLRRWYGGVSRVEVLSNAVFIPPSPHERQFEGRSIRVGHLSNLSRAKGIETVLECLRRLSEQGLDIEFVIAGPATDGATERSLAAATAEFAGRLHYLGALRQADVRAFYQSIDVFLFPTIYEHEAEPLVVIDAVSEGVPVIATDRGCIRYLLEATAGCVFAPDEFVAAAVRQIADWVRDRSALATASARARLRFEEMHGAAQTHLSDLLDRILRQG